MVNIFTGRSHLKLQRTVVLIFIPLNCHTHRGAVNEIVITNKEMAETLLFVLSFSLSEQVLLLSKIIRTVKHSDYCLGIFV